jgi:hypothetical protein
MSEILKIHWLFGHAAANLYPPEEAAAVLAVCKPEVIAMSIARNNPKICR